jgi:ribosomal protein L11 methyltransferase
VKYVWILKLKLEEKYREKIEEYLISLNATISSLDAENDTNSFKPKVFNTSAFFLKKPKNYIVQKFLENFNIEYKNILLTKVKIKDLFKENIKPLDPIHIGRFTFIEEKNIRNFILYKNIIIPAGLGFGTGHHPTTKGIIFILNKINYRKNIQYKNLIDIGCGSGILGITMAKLWKKNVELIDIDKQAIKTSITNAKLNHLNYYINVKKGDGLKKTIKVDYDIITINILAKPILLSTKLINKKLNKNGRVIISGILKHQKYMILNKLRGMGLTLEIEYIIDNWAILLIKKN